MPTIPACLPSTPTFPPALACDPPRRPPGCTNRGNPNLNLSPRCGAKTRSGCACRSPAVNGRLRCRMHGGRSTGPRTPEGLERLRAAHTTHGHYGARDRWVRCYFSLCLKRARVGVDARRYANQLPPELLARLQQEAPELQPSFAMPRLQSAAQERALRKAEAEALAPWKQAIAAARQGERERRSGARAHAPVQRRARAAGERRRQGGTVAGDDSAAVPRDLQAMRVVLPVAERDSAARAHAPVHGGGAGPAPAEFMPEPHATVATGAPPARILDPLRGARPPAAGEESRARPVVTDAPGPQATAPAAPPAPPPHQSAATPHAPVGHAAARPAGAHRAAAKRQSTAKPHAPDRPLRPLRPLGSTAAGRLAALQWKRRQRQHAGSGLDAGARPQPAAQTGPTAAGGPFTQADRT